jgi:ABC-type lipoprotein release transport system permease subunit
MMATGKSKYYILLIIMVKAFLIGFIGTLIGFFAGNIFAEYFGREIFRFTAQDIKPLWSVLGYAIIIFPVLWTLSSWIPALVATQIDAARILSRE